jgi:hypothetical protein
VARFEPPPDRQVPLVLYYNGLRYEVGKAIIRPDGSILAQINKDIRADLRGLILAGPMEVSIAENLVAVPPEPDTTIV